MTATAPQTSNTGFVRFMHRDSSFRGDRGTWARYDAETRTLTINLARGGVLSAGYRDEFAAFCETYGVDFYGLSHGAPVTVTLPEEEEASVETPESEDIDDPRMDLDARPITAIERRAFLTTADRGVLGDYAAGIREIGHMSRKNFDRAAAMFLETEKMIRRWTLANNPEALA